MDEMVRVESDGHELAAVVAGTGQPVLLLHGIPGSRSVWSRVVRELGVGYRCILPDLLGFGESSKPGSLAGLWADTQARAIQSLLDRVEAERIIVVAHDFGVPVAAELYRLSPGVFSGCVFAATNAFEDTTVLFPLSGVLTPVIGPLWERVIFSRPALKQLMGSELGRNETSREVIAACVGDSGQAASVRILFSGALRNMTQLYRPVRQALASMTVPTAVLWGTDDPFFPIAQGERTAKLIPGAEFLTVKGAGHFLPIQCPDAFIEAIDGIFVKTRNDSF